MLPKKLAYGDWKVSETKGVEGYEDVKPVYIHMETDTEKTFLQSVPVTMKTSQNRSVNAPSA